MDEEEIWDRVKRYANEILSLTRDLPLEDQEIMRTYAANMLLGNPLPMRGVLNLEVYSDNGPVKDVKIPYDRIIWLGEVEQTHDTSGHLEQYYYIEQNGCPYIVVYIVDGESDYNYKRESAGIKTIPIECNEELTMESS